MIEKRSKKNEKGITFAEVIICVFIVALIVGPIINSFISSTNNRMTAERIDAATHYAETMMQQIKEKMTTDIVQQQKRDGNKLKLNDLSADETIRYSNVVSKYLDSQDVTLELEDFLDKTSSQLLEQYETDRYAYEIIMWNLKKDDVPIDASSRTLTLNQASLDKASKFYTTTDYMLNSTDYTSPTLPISFKVSDDMYKLFKDSDQRYIPGLLASDVGFEIKDINEMKFDDSMSVTPTSTHNRIKVENQKTIKEVGGTTDKIVGYSFEINDVSGATFSPATGADIVSIINVDLTGLLRDPDTLSEATTYDNYTIKFINKSTTNQIIRVRRTAKDGDKISDQDKRFNVVVEDKSTGKSSIERVDEVEPFDNYAIAIIVRELSPVLGEKGKIVKKMFDVYSFDMTANKRR